MRRTAHLLRRRPLLLLIAPALALGIGSLAASCAQPEPTPSEAIAQMEAAFKASDDMPPAASSAGTRELFDRFVAAIDLSDAQRARIVAFASSDAGMASFAAMIAAGEEIAAEAERAASAADGSPPLAGADPDAPGQNVADPNATGDRAPAVAPEPPEVSVWKGMLASQVTDGTPRTTEQAAATAILLMRDLDAEVASLRIRHATWERRANAWTVSGASAEQFDAAKAYAAVLGDEIDRAAYLQAIAKHITIKRVTYQSLREWPASAWIILFVGIALFYGTLLYALGYNLMSPSKSGDKAFDRGQGTGLIHHDSPDDKSPFSGSKPKES